MGLLVGVILLLVSGTARSWHRKLDARSTCTFASTTKTIIAIASLPFTGCCSHAVLCLLASTRQPFSTAVSDSYGTEDFDDSQPNDVASNGVATKNTLANCAGIESTMTLVFAGSREKKPGVENCYYVFTRACACSKRVHASQRVRRRFYTRNEILPWPL